MVKNNVKSKALEVDSDDSRILEADMILTIALPGAGKSTWANGVRFKDPAKYAIVERDEIRETLYGKEYHEKGPNKKKEAQVTAVHYSMIERAFKNGQKVIVSDTNLNSYTLTNLAKIARKHGKTVSTKHFNVPVEECKRRNKARGAAGGREVPDDVIDGMAKRGYSDDGNIKEFLIGNNGVVSAVPRISEGMKIVAAFDSRMSEKYPIEGKAVAILDMDGTLFNNEKDSQFYLNTSDKKDYKGFYKSIESAPVNSNVVKLVNDMRENGINIIAVTGRTDDYANELISAIDRSGAKISKLIMKRTGDSRPSSEHKYDVINRLQDDGFAIVHAIDDREMDIRMFQSRGISTSIVNKPLVDLNNIQESYPEPDVNTTYGAGFCLRCGSKLKDPNKTIGDRCRTRV